MTDGLKQDPSHMKKVEESVFKFLLFKVKNLTLVPYLKHISPSQGTAKEARDLESKLRKCILLAYTCEVFFTLVDFYFSVGRRMQDEPVDYNSHTISEFEYFSLDAV